MKTDATGRAAIDPRLGKLDLRVLLVLQRRLDWEDYRPVKVRALADEVQHDKAHVSRALRHLTALGYLRRRDAPTLRQTHYYRLINPAVAMEATTGPR